MNNKPPYDPYEEFKRTLETVIVCPYCMSPNQTDPVLPCCSELHATTAYKTPAGNIYLDSELDQAYKEMHTVNKGPNLLHPDTKRLTIRAKRDIALSGTRDLFEVINTLYGLGYGRMTLLDIQTIKEYLERKSGD